MTHQYSNKEYVQWVAEVFRQNEVRNVDETCDTSKKYGELLLTPFSAVGRNGPRPGY